DVIDRHVDFAAVALDAGRLGPQADERPDRPASPRRGPSLEQVPEQDQRDDGRRDLVVDAAGAVYGVEPLRKQGRGETVEVRGEGADRDEGVHVRGAMPGGHPRPKQYVAAGPE